MEGGPALRKTFPDLWTHATERRWVQWYPSGTVEQLRLDVKKKVVLAVGPFTTYHFVATPKRPEKIFWYEVVDPKVKIPREILKAAAKKTRYWVGFVFQKMKEKLLPMSS